MSEVVHTQPCLLDVSRIGNHLVTGTTKYLSTLPHPIEAVEELVAVIAVTCSLLNSLHETLARFPSLSLSPSSSFLLPLCHDILYAFRLLSERVVEARRLKVFEPNDVGLVRLPRAAWCLVCGNEARAAGLRSRLYVEKYRVRVLIEAVCWVGLGRKSERTPMEENEFRALRNMLPVVAERLIGVERDYVPRLRKLAERESAEKEDAIVAEKEMPAPEPVRKTEIERPIETEPEIEKPILRSSKSSDSLASTCSSTSSVTVLNPQIITETWLLRRNESTKVLKSNRTLLGFIPLSKTYTRTGATYYVKPVLSSASETRALQLECQNTLTPAQHAQNFKKLILTFPQDAQWEIQKLLESREAACSGAEKKSSWEVTGFMVRPRRKIAKVEGKKRWGKNEGKGKGWGSGMGKGPVEYVLVLKGEVVDVSGEKRVLPKKHEDAWNPPAPVAARLNSQQANNPLPPPPQQQQQQQQQQQNNVGTVLRHVENRRVMSLEEAEGKMKEIEMELFVSSTRSVSPTS